MFSKALFKQSCKANGTMWAIITFAVCFMLACVMLISGSGNIGETKNAIEDTIVKQEIESSFKKRAISYYGYAQDGLMNFDRFYAQNAQEALTYHGAFAAWQAAMPQPEKLLKGGISGRHGSVAGENAAARNSDRKALCAEFFHLERTEADARKLFFR